LIPFQREVLFGLGEAQLEDGLELALCFPPRLPHLRDRLNGLRLSFPLVFHWNRGPRLHKLVNIKILKGLFGVIGSLKKRKKKKKKKKNK